MPARYLILLSAIFAIVSAAFVMPRSALGGGTCHKGQPVTEQRATTVTMSNNCFVATITRVDEGATVTFVNEDEAQHTVTGANFSWGQESVSKGDEAPDPYLGKGDTFEQTFDESGVYPYFCFLHPGMIGAVVVGDGENESAEPEGAVRPASLAISEQDAPAPNDPAAAAAAATEAGDDGSIVLPLARVAAGALAVSGLVVLAGTLAARRASAG